MSPRRGLSGRERLRPHLHHEEAAGRTRGLRVAGVDEVGRGPLAGPVVAAAVILPACLDGLAPLLAELDDSKTIAKPRRERLAAALLAAARSEGGVQAGAEAGAGALAIGIGRAEVAEIDRLNILQASFLAMRRAVEALPQPPEAVLVDGKLVPPLPCPAHAIVGGDAISLSIAAASIVAKVHRDALMTALAQAYPAYGWARNAGYGTREHREALLRFGATPHHRTSFAPVRARLFSQD